MNPSGGNSTFLVTWNTINSTGFIGTITRNGGVPFTGAEVFFLVMDGNANSDCQYSLSGVNIQPLPIELMSFYAVEYAGANLLVWEVASEVDNQMFEVERSTDGVSWELISSVPGAGNSSEQKKYGVLDETFRLDINYYRLKQVDFNGQFEYSQVISVDNRENEGVYLVRSVNLSGQEIAPGYFGVVLDCYNNGTVVKRIQ